jgi:phosphoribosylglycinamide formyltransferase-1
VNLYKLNLLICISGGGSTMLEVLKACADGRLPRVRPSLVISNKPDAGGINKAKVFGIPEDNIKVIPSVGIGQGFFGKEILASCEKHEIDLVALCGFLPRIPSEVISAYPNSMFNQHPAPLDNPGRLGFGGKGMHGRAAHQAVLLFSSRINRSFATCATTHRVTDEIDGGNMIGVQPVEILPGDDAEKLADRVLPKEHALVVQTIYIFSEAGKFGEYQRATSLIKEGEESILVAAKREASLKFPKG